MAHNRPKLPLRALMAVLSLAALYRAETGRTLSGRQWKRYRKGR